MVCRAIAEPKHRPEALAVLAKFAADGGNLRDVAELAVAPGDHEAAFAYPERAEEVGWPPAPIGVDPAFDPAGRPAHVGAVGGAPHPQRIPSRPRTPGS